MRTRTKRILIGAGVLCAVCAGLLAVMVIRRQAFIEQMEREFAARPFRPSITDSEVQLPEIVARSVPGGVVVTLGNDSSRLTVVITEEDRLIVEYESVRGGPLVREFPADIQTLLPGESAIPAFIALEDRSNSAKPTIVRFEHRERLGNGLLTARTEVTIP